MTLHRTLLAGARPQPWRNGGGSTRELLAWPQVQAWQLRVSVAQIDRDGPFSAFPGVDRCFAVIAGAGVHLQLPGGRQTLTPGSAPVAFDGEAAPGCSLVDGPTEDLNLMVRRGLGQAQMWHAGSQPHIDGTTRWRAVYAASACEVQVGNDTCALAGGELLWCEAAANPPWHIDPHARAWCLVVR
jgi:uncharacterized protein